MKPVSARESGRDVMIPKMASTYTANTHVRLNFVKTKELNVEQ